jgi:hypothetical protein
VSVGVVSVDVGIVVVSVGVLPVGVVVKVGDVSGAVVVCRRVDGVVVVPFVVPFVVSLVVVDCCGGSGVVGLPCGRRWR